ncbi:hypothetical protein FO440_10700 [Mucilaginibacter corticis]|uniref:Uncharacterized protein n=1 Tax=Mucilaginibacter corticis TaxID=2597670 RepID=A0A556MK26_9SPHI|nr:hypothetical protein [Mucilaginibacter corticis]TSJ40226.1 hypothetical protein FO440_10700 [Mucilaginibacter corticis]
MKFVRFILIILFFSAVIVSCQKDQNVDLSLPKATKADTSDNSGNFFAVKGTLNVTVNDSTYTFDATKDSIAFINVNIDSNKYFGITAINKAHTVSFGISSPGFAAPDIVNGIAGGQLLFSADSKHVQQYALTNSEIPGEDNQIMLKEYMKDSVLTKGTFSATMVNKTVSHDQPAQIVQGNFNLRIK